MLKFSYPPRLIRLYRSESTDIISKSNISRTRKSTVFCFVESSDASLKATSQFTYAMGSCNREFVDNFVEEFKTLIRELHQIYGICGDSPCNFVNIKVESNCKGRRRRRRRSNDNRISISFDEIVGYEKQQVYTIMFKWGSRVLPLRLSVKYDFIVLWGQLVPSLYCYL